jgi:hypothetical protein
MILIDNTQIILSSIFSQYKGPDEVNEEMIRHITLNTYRYYRNRFYSEYGELVICQDAGNYWRKDIFPHYKQNRKKAQAKDEFYWKQIFETLTMIRNEVAENMPYKTMRVERCEADDIIATLCKHYHPQEKILIVSGDKDFKQLMRYPNIAQYSPNQKGFITCDSPDKFLFEHIVRGDSGDGIPNILSEDDVFIVDEKRQRPLSAKKIDTWSSTGSVPHDLSSNWNRNQMLVDLSYIPSVYEQSILDEYKKPVQADRSKIFTYFVNKGLKNLMNDIQDF